jgi:kinesin family member C1
MVQVAGAQVVKVDSLEEASEVYEQGARARKVQATEYNEVSSRSHLIFTVIIQTFNSETKQKTKSKISFVDLAGSERYDK